jgi:DNA-binding transcriptional MerR regulator
MVNITVQSENKSCFGQLSEISGIDVDTIRYIQDAGLIDKSMLENTMDISTTVRYLKFIKRALNLRFSENEIKKFLVYIK